MSRTALPCPSCGKLDFTLVPTLAIHLWFGGQHLNSKDQLWDLVMCNGCGRTDWFACAPTEVAALPGAKRIMGGR